jgi:hypothetical protein
MATGAVTGEYDERASYPDSKPTCGLTLEIVVASGTKTKEEELDAAVRSCMNCLLTDLYLEAPQLATADKTVQLQLLTERNNEIFDSGAKDATSATDYTLNCGLERGLVGKTAFVITCDHNVTGDKTFYVELRGQ